MSVIMRIWNAIRNPVRYIGRDLEGNKYFESRSYNDPRRNKRTVQYHNPDDMWKYIGGGKRLPVQWSGWLTHTRRHPPTLEELEADLNRQRRVLANAQKIEERDKAEADKMKRVRQQDAHLAIEDAVNTRTERTHLETGSLNETAAPEPTLEAQKAPMHTFSRVLPPKFVTPPTPRRARFSRPFPLSPPLGTTESEVQTGSRDGGQSSHQQTQSQTSPWKTTLTETEGWTPKARKRG